MRRKESRRAKARSMRNSRRVNTVNTRIIPRGGTRL